MTDAVTEAIILSGFAADQATAINELNLMNAYIAGGQPPPVYNIAAFPGHTGPIDLSEPNQAVALYHSVRRMVTNAGQSGATLRTGILTEFQNTNPAGSASSTINDFAVWLETSPKNGGNPTLTASDIVAAFSGVPSTPIYGSGNPPAQSAPYESVSGNLLEPSTDYPGMSGLTSYHRVEGHFHMKQLPDPKVETLSRTVQGLADQFEAQFEDPSVASLVSTNDRVRLTEAVFQGPILSAETQTRVSTYTDSTVVKHAIVAQGGDSFKDSTYGNVVSSGQDTMVAIAVEDVRPFALKGLDLDEDALFDLVEPTKPTNENYVRHLTPEKETRIAVLETPQALQDAGGPPRILIHYSAIDLTGEVVAGWKGSSWFTDGSHAQTYRNDMDAINTMSKKAWLVVERTVPDTNTVFVDNTSGYPSYRTILDWLRRPYGLSQFSSPPTYTPLTIHAPGGIISVPSKDFAQRGDHALRMNPTGDAVLGPFVNLENCAHTVMQGAIAGTRKRTDAYGPPQALSNTRTPVERSDSTYHTLTIRPNETKTKQVGSSASLASLQPVNLEQFDIIDNRLEGDRHLLLIQPSNRERTKTLDTVMTALDSAIHHECSIELTLMRGRVEEIAPNSGEDVMSSGATMRGRTQLVDVSDRIAERDFDLNEGFPLKEIGDLGSPTVSITMGGLGQGGIDVAPDRTEHSFLPVWKDRVVGGGNPSVRNDRQTSTYYASTRALVEVPIFPSMFYDVEQILPESTNKRSPLPSDQSMEVVVDCTMTAVNRPQMGRYENRWAIDWGLRGDVSALKINDYESVVDRTRIRFMRDNAATTLGGAYSSSETSAASGTTKATAYIEVDSVYPFINEGGFTHAVTGVNSTAKAINNTGGYGSGSTKTVTVDTDIRTVFKIGDEVYNASRVLLGVVSSLTATTITFEDNIAAAVSDNELLYSPIWNFSASSAAVNDADNGFAVTVGEGILGDAGIRLHIFEAEVSGLSHRLRFNAFHDWTSASLSLTNMKAKMTVGLPVVMGCWLADTGEIGTVWPMTGFDAGTHTSNANMASNFVDPMRFALMLGRVFSTKSAVSIDPDDSSRVLIKNGPTMEGFVFDPGNHLYSDDDMPLLPPVECRSSYLALKGKKADGTLEYVRPLRINMGEVANSGKVSNFREAVDEFIRRINQAGHPNARNTAGGSAFDPPLLFDTTDGDETVVSDDTGTHMGYVRAFLGDQVESRDGETGLSVVIHATVPGATGRNFCLWFHNSSPYPYRPVQAVGHGGLLATNSRSYQASSFPAPLPLGMDGETHVPITTFQGGVHGDVEDAAGSLRTYSGIGSVFEFKTVRRAKRASGEYWPVYNEQSFPHLAVERRALDYITRISQIVNSSNLGLILVDGDFYGTFEAVAAGIGSTDARAEGPGSCAFLQNVRPLDGALGKKWAERFVNRDGEAIEATVRIISPLPDAHGILFFGGGHTGTVFDISDGTANDYSDFYTHHYSQGPSGYSGFQNLHEVQTSAAVLDFTEIRDRDTIKENTYRGLHGKMTVTNTGTTPAAAHSRSRDALFYIRLSEDVLNANHGTGEFVVAEELHDRRILAFGNMSSCLITGPTGDPTSKGLDFYTATGAFALHKIESSGEQQTRLLLPVAESMQGSLAPATEGDYSISFFFKATVDAPWISEAYGNGPVLHGYDASGNIFGVFIESKEGVAPDQIDFVVHSYAEQTGGGVAGSKSAAFQGPKAEWYHIVVTRGSGNGGSTFYVNGAAQSSSSVSPPTQNLINNASYDGGSSDPHLPENVGVGTRASSGVLVNKSGGYTAGSVSTIAVDTVSPITPFPIGSEVLDDANALVGIVHSTAANSITFTQPILVDLANNENLKKVTALSASSLYGRTDEMMTLGVALHTFNKTSGYYYGKQGSNSYDPIYFKGALSDVCLWGKILTSSDVTELYGARSTWD